MRLSTDSDVNKFLDEVGIILERECGYSRESSMVLINEYYTNFTNEDFCREMKIPVQNDDFFFHEGAGGMALRIHYYLGIQGDPAPDKFIEWRSNLRQNS